MLSVRRSSLALLGCLALGMAPIAFSASAQDAPAATAPAQRQDAGQFIQDLGNRALAVIADKSLGAEQKSQHYHELLRQSFDLQTLGRFVIGRNWQNASPAQQQEYLQLFEALIVKTYGDRLNFSGEKFTVKSSRPEGERDTVVSSEIISASGGKKPTAVDWRVRERDGKLGIIDVLVENVSLSMTQRDEYASIIQRDGGKIDGLLAEMRKRLDAPSETAPM